jgi:hypothetical protein
VELLCWNEKNMKVSSFTLAAINTHIMTIGNKKNLKVSSFKLAATKKKNTYNDHRE